MQISEYSFPHLNQFKDDQFAREIEYRRIVEERMLEDGPLPDSRPSVLQRVARRIRAAADSSRGTASSRGSNRLPTSS